jgi:chromosome partitioning protein
MAVISIANAKGGAGKTTVALLLAMEFAQRGEKVVIFDCDPLEFAAKWHRRRGGVDTITVMTGITFANLGSNLRVQQGQGAHIIIDLSGARDALIALTAGLSDLVLIPVQGGAMDAQGAAHVLDLIGQVETNAHSHINHAVVLTRVSSFVTTRAMRSVKALLASRNIALLDTPIIERSAYRDVFEHGGTLYNIDAAKVSNLGKAQLNMQALALDVQRFLGAPSHPQSSGPFSRMCHKTLASGAQPVVAGEPAFARAALPY